MFKFTDLLSHLEQPFDLRLDSSKIALEKIKEEASQLTTRCDDKGATLWFSKDQSASNIRIKRYSSEHTVFYNSDGRRFLMIDPEKNILHECEWKKENGKTKLANGLVSFLKTNRFLRTSIFQRSRDGRG